MVSAIRVQDVEDKDLLQKQLQDSTVGLVLNATYFERDGNHQTSISGVKVVYVSNCSPFGIN